MLHEKMFHVNKKKVGLHKKVFHVGKSKMMLYQKNTLCAKKLLIFYGTAHRNRCYELLDRNMRSGTEIVNPCINLILLLVDLCFRVVSVLVKNRLRRHVTYAPEIFHKSSIIFHKSSIILKFLKNISL